VSGDVHAGFCEHRGVRFPPVTPLVICVAGERHHAEELIVTTEQVIAPLGLSLSNEKTRVVHIDEGIDFLGWRIKRQRTGSDGRRYVYTYPSKRSLAAVRRRSGRSRGLAITIRSTSSCIGSTRCCGTGAPIFAAGCPRRPSPTSTPFTWWRWC
jgi:hypothetical protein